MIPEGPAIPVVTTPTHRHHDPPYELNAGQHLSPVYERPERVDAILSGLPTAERHPARDHPDEPLLAVHDAGLVRFLRDGYDAWRRAGGPEVMLPDTFRSPRWAGGGRPTTSALGSVGWWCFDTATPIVAGSFEAARAAVDVALTAADLVADGVPLAYALTRPPGHHAGADYFGGFCLLNYAAIVARHLQAGGRVAILDIDVHHGNGTQDVFWRDSGVLYASLHADPNTTFPYFSGFAEEVGEGPGRGTTRNVALAPGTGDTSYLAALEATLDEIVAFDPVALVVSLGLDASTHDPIGPLDLTVEGFSAIGARIAELTRPTVVVQEGGYALNHLGELAAAVLGGMARGRR